MSKIIKTVKNFTNYIVKKVSSHFGARANNVQEPRMTAMSDDTYDPHAALLLLEWYLEDAGFSHGYEKPVIKITNVCPRVRSNNE